MSAAAPRPLAEITADALLTAGCDCYWCWGGWGNRCATGTPGGMHAGRYRMAARTGLISRQDLAAATGALGPDVTDGTVVICEEARR